MSARLALPWAAGGWRGSPLHGSLREARDGSVAWFATAEIYCSVVQRQVTLRFLTYDGRHPMGVVSCSAFSDPTAHTCGTAAAWRTS